MFEPHTYAGALMLLFLSMFCWGSWANTMKLTPGWPFQAFYWDYVIGIVIASLVWGFTLGSLHGNADSLLHNLAQADRNNILLAIAGGLVFNVANVLLVAAIELAGLAVAFPIGIGLALIIGVLLNYLTSPIGNPLLLLLGVLTVALAVLIDGIAYRRRETRRSQVGARGIWISIVAGILMGLFYPLVAHALRGPGKLGPYSVAVCFSIGVLLCTIPLNIVLMRRPLTLVAPVRSADYTGVPASYHVWAILGGVIWCTGAIANFVASNTALVGPATSYGLGQGATMISAAWGVFVWREFAGAPAGARRLIPWMFLLFMTGLVLVAVAPLSNSH